MESKILDYTELNGLVFCNQINSAKNNAEILYISEAKKLGIDAVLFRRYYENINTIIPVRSEPAVCIFYKDESFFNSPAHIKLHAALWSAGRNEIYIIQSSTRTDIINARKPAMVQNGHLSLENLLLASTSTIEGINEERFSAYLFGNGTFWEQPFFTESIDEKNSPYIFLLDYLMTVRKEFTSSEQLNLLPETIDKLLVTSILIKFLEDITDDKGKHTLRNLYKKHKIQTFAEVVENGLLISILNDLSNEFNGKIFDKFSELEKNQIANANLNLLAKFLRANINLKTNQLFIWEQYSFKHLPAEVISAIYENFIQAESVRNTGGKEKGVVYTPIHLVNLLIDEVMPLDKPELFKDNSFRVFDPSCGSGVFLVAAFKRLLQWWAINNSTRDNIQYPDSKISQKILEDNIFGVDLKKTATLVSVFSLTTALLDKLTPQEIWNNLELKDLSQKNIQHKDFFEWCNEAVRQSMRFNLVIGNPPFNPIKGISKKSAVSKENLELLNIKPNFIPDNNFALKFFEGGLFFADKICMIIPSTVVLYSKNSQKYRTRLFTNFTVNKIYDFTHLRRDLFHKAADTPVIAIIAQNTPSIRQDIEHIVVKRMIASEKKIRFEIDYYDFHKVPWSWAIDESKKFVWKANLLGGGRLFHLIHRLSFLPTLKDFITTKKDEDSNWIYSSGYKIGGKSTKKNPAEYLHLKSTIDTKKKFNAKSHAFSTTIENNFEFEAPRKENLYQPPLLIISEVLGTDMIPMQVFDTYQPFNISFIGIHAPTTAANELKEIYKRLYEDKQTYRICRMYMLLTSSKLLIHKETAFVKEDFDRIPYPSEKSLLTLSDSEKIVQFDILNYYIHLGKSIAFRSSGNILQDSVNKNQLESFGAIFCNSLNELYGNEEKCWQIGTSILTSSYVIYQFGFGKIGGLKYTDGSLPDNGIKELIEDKLSNSGAIYQRVIRIYTHIDNYDCIFFIKPLAQRYWLNSIALRDADDTFLDLKQAGY